MCWGLKPQKVQADAQIVSLETLKDLAQQREMQADTLLKAGKTQDAIGMFGKALELLVKLYGEDSAQAAPILINMATAMQRLKSFDEAEAKVQCPCLVAYISILDGVVGVSSISPQLPALASFHARDTTPCLLT